MIYPPFAPGDRKVPWLVHCLSDWHFKPIKYLCTINKRVLGENTYTEFEFRYIDIGCVDSNGNWNPSDPMFFNEAPSRARRIVSDGDVLVSTVRTYLRAITHIPKVSEPLICSTGFAVISAGTNVDSAFLAYWVRSKYFVDEVVARSVGVSYPGINASDIGNLPLPILEKNRQLNIAAFLDRETARIDALIEKKERQIELLKEKRAALISHAVTKGLDPNVKVKDSGVEWLGEIPAHWVVKLFKYGVTFQEGPGIMADDFCDIGTPLLRIGNLTTGQVSLKGCNYLDEEKVKSKWHHFRLKEGDLLISCSATTGIVSEVGEDAVGCIPYTGLIRLQPLNKVTIKSFIKYIVVSKMYIYQIDLFKAGTAIQHYGPTHLRQIIAVFPPQEEQNLISNYLDHETARIDELIEKVQHSIELLKEYRTALISAAVTGKIDVHEE